jgi:hypothetical protein
MKMLPALLLAACAHETQPTMVAVDARVMVGGALVATPHFVVRSGETARIATGDIDLVVSPTVTKGVRARGVSRP